MKEIRNEVKINYRFNLCKLIVLRALNLKGGWHDVTMICMATGLRHSTIAGHVKYWALDMRNKKNEPVHLLLRTASTRGKRLAWRYRLGPNGETWLKCVPPELLREVTNKLIARWKAGITSFDGGDDTLKALAPSLIPSLSMDQITLTNGENLYLKLGDSNYYQGWEFKSGYQEKTFTHIPLHCKWTRSKQVAYAALKNLLGDDLPISQTFVLAGLQSEGSVVISPVNSTEESIPINTDSTLDLETVPEEVVETVKENWWNHSIFALPGITFEELYLSYDDRPSALDRPGFGDKKRLVLAQRAWEIKRTRDPVPLAAVAAPVMFNPPVLKLINPIPPVKVDTVKIPESETRMGDQ